MILMWEYGNEDVPFLQRKFDRVSRLVRYGALARFHVCVYDAYWHSQSIKHVDACCIHGKTNVIWWHGLRQSHRDDHAHNIAWICTYSNRLERICTLQGQEHSWLVRVACVTTNVHYTKCTITNTFASIYIYIYIRTYIVHNAITHRKVK